MQNTTDERLLRVEEILGLSAAKEKKAAKDSASNTSSDSQKPLIPISRASWYNGVKSGRYPLGVKLGPHMIAWRWSDIQSLIEKGVD